MLTLARPPLRSYHTKKVSTPSVSDVKNVSTGTDKGQMQQDGDQAVEHLRTLGKLIFTNSEARKLLKDIGLLARDVAADAATHAADLARPDEERLRQIDEPAPSNQWVGPNGEVRDHNSPAPDTGLAAKKEQAQHKLDEARNAKEEAKGEARDRAQNVAGAADQGQQSQAGPATGHIGSAGDAANQAQQYGHSGQTTSSATGLGAGNGQPPYFTGGSSGASLDAQPGSTLATSQGGFSSAQPATGGFSSAHGTSAGGFSGSSQPSDAQVEEGRQRAEAGKEAGVGQAKQEGREVKNKLLAKVPDEHKDRAREQADKAKVRFSLTLLLSLLHLS